jgi:hypothetical protein
VTEVLADYPQASLTEVSIDADEELKAEYREHIPVLLIDGKVHNFWRIDPDRLRKALG